VTARTALAVDPEGPTLAELAEVAAMAAEAARLCREVTETLARWGMDAMTGG